MNVTPKMRNVLRGGRRRTTLWAAFNGMGSPVFGVYDFDRRRLETLISDRQANGEAFDGEHPVRITVSMYNRILAVRGWPTISPGGAR